MAPEEFSGSTDYDYPPLTNVTGNWEVFSKWEVFFMTVFIPVLYSFIFFLGLLGNLFVIVLMAKRSGGRSVERYLVIRKVLDTKTVGSQRHIRITCGIIWTMSLLLGAPSLVYRRLDGDDCWDEDGEDFSLAMVFLTFLLPLGVISFCYCSIYCRLQRHVRLGRGIRRSHCAVVTIVAAFLCSWLPLNACKVLLFFLAKGTLVLSQGQEVAL
ncbi:PREDICTED: probable G-protein coupled receptor 25, partial [Eurypyga helias]|uniref:probable G-protein coupled receptor 25 n=1 Tax=Eurypyga helias TaxID=54383 RepID=UPI0005290174